MKQVAIFLCIALMMSFVNAQTQNKELEELQALLLATRASWTAAENEISMLPRSERQQLLGLLPGVFNPQNVPIEVPGDSIVLGERYEAPHTSIKNQGSCGSCYAFGACATYESFKKVKGTTYDVSEQYFMMKAKAIGPYGGCQGWYLDTSMNLLKNYGTCDESSCSYKGYETSCSCTPNHKIGSWSSTTSLDTIKSKLSSGALYLGFAVYKDFMYYSGGYYEYTSGSLEGYHAVCVVGYDGTGLKIKNSWGTGWGESGYVRFKFSEMKNAVQLGTCFGGTYYINN